MFHVQPIDGILTYGRLTRGRKRTDGRRRITLVVSRAWFLKLPVRQCGLLPLLIQEDDTYRQESAFPFL